MIDVIDEFRSCHADVDVFDPWVDAGEARHEYGLDLIDNPAQGHYDAIILAVAHRQFVELGAAGIRALGKPGAILFDVKHALSRDDADDRL